MLENGTSFDAQLAPPSRRELETQREDLLSKRAASEAMLRHFALEPSAFDDATRAAYGKDYHEAVAELAEVHATLNALDVSEGLAEFHDDAAVLAEGERKNSTGKPLPLPDMLLVVPSFDEVLLPESLRGWIADIAARMQCPLEFPAVGVIVALASLVGCQIGIRPKQYDDWTVVPNLWGCAIGRPGILKSPALAEVLKPLRQLEALAINAFAEAQKDAAFQAMVQEERRGDLKKKISKALATGDDVAVLRSELRDPPPLPTLRRYIVNDSTVEKLGELLNENPHGLLVFRDELPGWLRSLDKDGHENDRAFYLEAWDGTGGYTYDRIGRGTKRIEHACVSMLGSIQPGPLAEYLRAAVRGGGGDDGLMQRFQLAVFPDDTTEWKNVDRWPDSKAKRRAYDVFTKLDTLTSKNFGTRQRDDETMPTLAFDPDAQEFFNEWRTDLERNRIRSPRNHPVMESHLAKYRSLMPSLALLFHLPDAIEGTTGNAVSLEAAKQAASWCDFLEAHARRIYSGLTQHATASARALAERMQSKALTSPFTARDVYRPQWRLLTSPDEVREALAILEDFHWVRSETLRTTGRSQRQYHIHPNLGAP